METKKVSPLVGAMSFLGTLATGNPCPDEQFTTKLPDGITVDTALPKDTLIWETGIERLGIEGEWVIVEQYADEEEAKIGHNKWVELLTKTPDAVIKDIDMWSLERGDDN